MLAFFIFFVRLPPSFSFHFLDDKPEPDPGLRIDPVQTVPSQSCPFPARMMSNRRVTDPTHFQDVRLIEFDISGSRIEYGTIVQSRSDLDPVLGFELFSHDLLQVLSRRLGSDPTV